MTTLQEAVNEVHKKCSNSFWDKHSEWRCVGCDALLSGGSIAALAAHQTAQVMQLFTEHTKEELRLDWVRKSDGKTGSISELDLSLAEHHQKQMNSDLFGTEIFTRRVTNWEKLS